MEKTKIVFVWPRGGDIKQGMPLAFGYLKSNTDNSRYDIRMIDCTLDDIDPLSSDFINRIKQLNPELVGVSSWSLNFSAALLVFKTIKQINSRITTIYGGPYATISAEKLIRNNTEIDFIFRGEAEFSFPLFLDKFNKTNPDFSEIKGLVYRDGTDIKVNEIARIENLDKIKIPDYNLINLNQYIEKGYSYQISDKKCAPILATRGCPYRCAFCSVPIINGRKIRKHSIDYMIQWIKILYMKYGVRGFNVIDDNFTFDVNYAKTFCAEVIKLNYKDIEFNSPNGVRMQKGDSELWRLMKQAGWRIITVAPESGSELVLKRLRKDLDPKIVPNITRDIKAAGLKVQGFFMIGCPEETVDDLSKTEALITECDFDKISVTNFQPVRGTPIYDELLAKKEIEADYSPSPFGDYQNRGYIPSTLEGFNFSEFAKKLYKIVSPELMECYRGFNILKYRDKFYAFSLALGHLDLPLMDNSQLKEFQRKKLSFIGDSIKEIKKRILKHLVCQKIKRIFRFKNIERA